MLDALDGLSAVARKRGRTEVALDACERALDIVETLDGEMPRAERPDAKLQQLDHHRRVFNVRTARVRDSPQSTAQLYGYALRYVLEQEPRTALPLFVDIWTRDQFGPSAKVYRLVLGAGVAHVALQTALDIATDTLDREQVLAAVDPHVDRLSRPSRAVFEQLQQGETAVSSAQLQDELDGSLQNPSLSELERAVFAGLLGLLQDDDSTGLLGNIRQATGGVLR
jgi:hypothetical protein